ncbi:hypothetical protein [Cytobacillus horneckiae]
MSEIRWGVCVGENDDMEIVKIFKNQDDALQDALFTTQETQIVHTVKPVKKIDRSV